jgi:hypothetical protein
MLKLNEPEFCRWFCKQASEIEYGKDYKVITFPFRPRNDEQVSIYLEKESDNIRIHDDGETLGNIFIDTGLDEKSFSEAQNDYLQYLLDLNGIKYYDRTFSITIENPTEELVRAKALDFLQFTLQVANIDALRAPLKEVVFAQRVFKAIHQKVPGLIRNQKIDFGFKDKIGDPAKRIVDLFREGNTYLLGKAVMTNRAADTALMTWQFIDQFTRGRTASKRFSDPQKKILVATIYNKGFDPVYVDLMKFNRSAFEFPTETKDIINFFNESPPIPA